MGSMGSENISIIAIGRNEEERVGDCLNAAVQEAKTVGADVIFVDCASTDRTYEIAVTYPIIIVRMTSDNVLTASAARQTGIINTSGEFIVFVDGDCVLEPGWVSAAVRFLQENPDAAGVRGRLDEIYINGGQVVGGGTDPLGDTDEQAAETIFVGGNAVYRREALDSVGGFNPYIRSLEEPDLCFRLMKRGMSILSIPKKMATHYTEQRWTARETVLRFSKGLCAGYGQVLRASLRHGYFSDYVRRENRTFLFLFLSALGGMAAAYGILAGAWVFLFLWGGMILIPFVYIAGRNKSIKWPLIMYTTWFPS